MCNYLLFIILIISKSYSLLQALWYKLCLLKNKNKNKNKKKLKIHTTGHIDPERIWTLVLNLCWTDLMVLKHTLTHRLLYKVFFDVGDAEQFR